MRPAVALTAVALTAVALAAPTTLAAQAPQGAGVSAYAYGFLYDEGWELGAIDENHVEEGIVSASARKGSAYAQASAKPITGQLKGSAYSGHWRDVGMSGATIAQYVTISNASEDSEYYELEMFLHAQVFGQCQVAFRCPRNQPVAKALFSMSAWLVDDAGKPTFNVGFANLGANGWTNGFNVVKEEFFEERTGYVWAMPGTNRYLFEFTLSFEAIAGFNVIGEQTASIYLPQGDGMTVTPEGEFLAQQARPQWASTAVPEPATFALLGTGLAVVAGGAARRRRRA